MDFNELTDEQKAKAKACKTPEELIELARAEGVELTDEQLEAVSGGQEWYCYCDDPVGYENPCPKDRRW